MPLGDPAVSVTPPAYGSSIRFEQTASGIPEPVSHQPPPDGRIVVALAAEAAMAWGNAASEQRSESLERLCRVHAELGRRLGQSVVGTRPVDFIDRLRSPLGTWIPDYLVTGDDAEVALLDGDVTTAAGELLALEHRFDSTSGVYEAELTERRVVSGMFELSQDGYVRARRFLIEVTAGTSSDLIAGCADAGFRRPADLYEPIPAVCVIDGRWWPCPRCAWPMRAIGHRLVCTYPPHAEHAAAFSLSPDGTVSRARPKSAPPPAPQSAEGTWRLRPAVWKFITIPGLAELDLAERIRRKVPGASVELWPEHDAVDVRVSLADTTYDADLKDWCSPDQLAWFLLHRAREGRHVPSSVVVPDHRRRDVRVLNAIATANRLPTTFEASSGFITRVSRAARGDRDN